LPPKIRAGETPIVTGFIAATEEGKPSTLGRGGSDYTATLLGGMLDADAVWIWTDVDGVKRADPDIVSNATTLPRLTYEEAAELSYFGAQVIHPKSIDPVAKKQVPLVIKNTQNPEGPDTTILNGEKPSTGLKSVTSISDLTLVTVKGHGMIGVPGIAAEVFTAVAEAEVNVLMISQSSSEQNITFLVERSSAPKAIESLEGSLEEEIRRSIIRDIVTEEPVSIVAAVGSGLSHQTGIDSGVFGSLARHGVNLLSIAQGSSDHNISVVVASQDEGVAVQSIYEWIQSENQQS
jgi:aspartate kinase